MPFVNYMLFGLWVAAMAAAIWAGEAARMFARRMQKAQGRGVEGTFTPPVALILPVKGTTADDPDTLANLTALFTQDYPNYRLLFAVESVNDPIITQIQRLQQEGSVEARIVVAGIATERGQKVHNQLAALEQTSEADEVVAFVDADARPAAHWLRELVGPLKFPEIGAATGFRFYVPEKAGAASAVVSVINAGVAALLGPYNRNSAWGGSMAMRRADFYGYGVHDAWKHALSDDYVLSFIVKKKAKKSIAFAAHCLVASMANFTFGSFFEFATRQYRITRICEPVVWLTAVTSPILYLSALVYTVVGFVLSVVNPAAGQGADFGLLAMFVALYGVSVYRGYCLMLGGQAALPAHAEALAGIKWYYTILYPFVAFMNLLALLKSAVSRTIVWRGIRYTMHSRTETTVVRSEGERPEILEQKGRGDSREAGEQARPAKALETAELSARD